MTIRRNEKMSATLSKKAFRKRASDVFTVEVSETEDEVTMTLYSLEIEIPFDEITTRTN